MDSGSLVNLWPYLAALALLAAIAWFSLRHGSVPGARPLSVACLFTALWLAGAVAELLVTDLSAKIAWHKVQVACQLPAVTAATCFALEYANPGRWLTRRTLALLSVAPLLALLLILTNGLHHWYWPALASDGSLPPLSGPAIRIALGYGLALVLVNTTAFVWLFIRSPQHRWPIALMIAGQVAGRALYAVGVAGGRAALQFDPVLLSLVIPMAAYAVALFSFRILDPLPAARRAAIEQMHDGMLVFDAQWRALSLNPAAERILGVPAARARAKPLAELVPALAGMGRSSGPESRLETSLLTSGEPRRYVLDSSPLQDHRGLLAGYLLLIRDVTEQRRAQAQLLEQHSLVATLKEREHLARELHDDLGQTLGYVSMQAQAIQKRLDDGDTAAVGAQLTRLAEVAQEAHAELRESILSLKAGSAGEWSFFGALRQHLAAFQDHYGIATRLAIPAGLEEGDLLPETGAQLLRVIQEALANAHKHGHAGRVEVTFERDGGAMQIVVADDGCGFDLDQPPAPGQHWGLTFMRERMAQVGGSVSIESRPGAGTRIALQVPLRDSGEEP